MIRRVYLSGLGSCAAALTLAGLSACAHEQKAVSDTVVLTGFNLIDGAGGAPKPNTAMIVEAGKVAWVGSAADMKTPRGAKPLDMAGKTIMPGLIDLHVHVAIVQDLVQDKSFYTQANLERELKTYASYGVTTVQTMGTDEDIIYLLRNAQRTGRPSISRVFTAGQGVVFKGGYGGVVGMNHQVSTPEEAAVEVDRQAAKGADLIKFWVDDELGTMPIMPDEISKAVIDAAHRHGLKAYAHIFYLKDAKRLVDQGVDGFAHSVRDQPIDQALIDVMKAKGVVQIAETLSREASMSALGGPASMFDDPFFQRAVTPKTLEILRTPERQQARAANPNYSRFPAFLAQAEANTKRLRDAGVIMGFGTDSGPPGRPAGYPAHWELELLVKSGLTPLQALTMATGDAAKILGAKDIGVLEAGRWADFIVLDADPTVDILNSRKINAVYIAGTSVWASAP